MNPPGYLYALSYVLCSCLIYRCVKGSLKEVSRKPMVLLFSVGIVAWMTISDGVSEWLFWPCMAVTISLIYGLLRFAYEFQAMTAFYYTAHVFILGEVCGSIEWQMVYFLNIFTEMGSAGKWLWNLLTYVIVYGTLCLVERKVHRRDLEIEINKKQAISVNAMGLAIFCLSNLSYVAVETPFSVSLPKEIFNIHTWVDIGGLAILIAYHVMVSEVQARLEMENLQNIMQMQYNNYIISEQSMDIVNQKYHDLKH